MPEIIYIETVESERNGFNGINKEQMNSFFLNIIIKKEELGKLNLNDKKELFYERLKNYPTIIIISLYKEYYEQYHGKEIKILSPESCLYYIIDLKKFIGNDYDGFHKKLNIIERAISTEGNQPKHQKKYKKYKNEIEEYRKRVFKLYNFLKLDLISGNNIFELNFKKIKDSTSLIDNIKGGLDNLEEIFYIKILVLLNEESVDNKKGIDKLFSQIFGTLHYGEQKLLRDEVRRMLTLSLDNICLDEDFLNEVLKNQKKCNGFSDRISSLLLNK